MNDDIRHPDLLGPGGSWWTGGTRRPWWAGSALGVSLPGQGRTSSQSARSSGC